MCRSRSALRVAIAVSLALSFGGAAARAQELDATLTTLLIGHADPRDGRIYTVVPAYEMASLEAHDIEVPGFTDFRLVASGWGMVQFGDETNGEGDLDVAFAEGKTLKGRLTLRLGRQLVSGGAARMTQLDGLDAYMRIGRGFSVEAYGGVPVTPRFGVSRGDAMVGGRVGWRPSYDIDVGLSAVDVVDQGVAARQDAALDGRAQLLRHLTLTEYTLFSLAEMRLAEQQLALLWQATGPLQASVEWHRTAPDLFLPRTSVLSVFADATRDELGGNVFWRPVPALELWGDYHAVVDDEGLGHRGGLKATLRPGRRADTTVGAELRVFHVPENGYWEARLFGMRRLSPVFMVTLDVDSYLLEKAINNDTFSFTVSATAGWDFASGWRVVLVGLGDSTPYVTARFEGMVKLVYNHTLRVHRKLEATK